MHNFCIILSSMCVVGFPIVDKTKEKKDELNKNIDYRIFKKIPHHLIIRF